MKSNKSRVLIRMIQMIIHVAMEYSVVLMGVGVQMIIVNVINSDKDKIIANA